MKSNYANEDNNEWKSNNNIQYLKYRVNIYSDTKKINKDNVCLWTHKEHQNVYPFLDSKVAFPGLYWVIQLLKLSKLYQIFFGCQSQSSCLVSATMII